MDSRYVIRTEDVDRISEWIKSRGGIAIWQSINLSDPGKTITTPVLNAEGKEVTKPLRWVDDKPARVITDPAEVWVSVDEEVKRFRVGVRMGSQGLSLKVTDGGTRRIRREVARAGEGAYYIFDYDTQEAVILRPVSQKRLSE